MVCFNHTFLTNMFRSGKMWLALSPLHNNYVFFSENPQMIKNRRFIYLSLRQEEVFECEKDCNMSIIHVHVPRLTVVMILIQDCI